MNRSILLSLLILISASHALSYKKQSIDITVGGKSRNMVVFTPTNLPAKSPLFIVTHGMNQDPEYQYNSDKMYEMIDTAKFVIAYLRSVGNTWDIGGTSDQKFVLQTINEMATRFDIDKERVYWSGYSMGSMLLHHCIANVQDKIAAFAPTSGIQFSEQPWNNCKKPVNLLECIAYADNVFGYEEYGIHAYLENYAKHDKQVFYSKTSGYKPISSSWYNGDLEKWTGGTNGGEVWLYSFNNGGHWPQDLNRHLIWNFCKRFSLNMPTVRISEPAGETTHLSMAPANEVQFPDVTIKATAKAPGSKVSKVVFYDGKKVIDSVKTAPYQVTLTAPTTGKHNLRAEVFNEKGKSSSYSCLVANVNNVARQTAYNLLQTNKNEGAVPQNWYASNGSTKRAGGGLPYTTGCRTLRFTNSTRSFQYGLLVQNATGKEKAAWAKFGVKEGRSALTLHAGSYTIKYKVCNWNQPAFTPVTIVVESLDGQVMASQTYTPTVNIGNNTANKFSGVTQQTFEFDVPETGDYVIAIYADATRHADFVLGTLTIQALSYVTAGIHEINVLPVKGETVYDLSGRRIDNGQWKMENGQLKRGIYVINGRKTIVK